MRNGWVELETTDGPMRAYEAAPEGAVLGAVIVIQEAFGINDHIQDVTRRFARAAYHAVAPEIFHRAGGGTAPYDDFSKVMPLFEGLSDEALLCDIDASIEYLGTKGFAPGQMGTVGFCMGGRVTFLVATERRLGAAVGFYGGGIVTGRLPLFGPLVDKVPDLQTPWLGLFGDLDKGIPVEDVEQLRARLDADATVAHDIVRYPEADHGFHCDARPSYNEEAAKDGWTRTLQWLADHVVPAGQI